jgi:hypothetical protein
MTRTLANPADRATLVARLDRLRPDSPRQWGKMTPHQAMCHLSDSFRSMMGDTPITSIATLLSRTVIKWVALRAPVKWPQSVPTRPEVDQLIGGTKPVDFARDRDELKSLIEQFASKRGETFQPHPMFGRLTTEEWQRWGWLHTDHHLRQFGV